MVKIALIFGSTGMDGSHLAELLLNKGYKVIGVKRRTSLINTERVDHLYNNLNFKLVYGDMNDVSSMYRILMDYQPDEIYNLAAQSHVKVSFEVQENTVDTICMGTLRLLNAVKDIVPTAKYYQASSSEMYGKVLQTPQSEMTPFNPRSPYACAKVFGFFITKNYREAYNIHASNGILFNHTGPRRGETFVCKKISLAAARIKLGLQNELLLGNLDAKRDWGFSEDYVKAMHAMLQQPRGDDYVIATGETHSVKEFVQLAFDYVGLDWQKYVKISPKYFRPSEVDLLIGDPGKAHKILQWQPTITFEQLVHKMVDYDLEDQKKNGK